MKAYEGFFTGTATVAGALVGLLFVAVSVAPDRLRGDNASIEHQAIASTALTALVDALFISLIGLQPSGGRAIARISLGGGLTLFGTAITRSWELIGLEGGGPLDLLARRLGAREPLNPEPGEQDPEPGPR